MAKPAVPVLSLDISQPGFTTQKESVLNAIDKDANYSEISEEDRVILNGALSVISGKLLDDNSFAALSAEDRQQLLSQQKLVNELLVKVARDSMVICKDEARTGTRLQNKVCRTRAGHRLYAKLQREAMERSTNGTDQINSKVSDDISGN
ncbi:MAG: hypothetical protein ACREO1_15150 [Arenimonas sp.]